MIAVLGAPCREKCLAGRFLSIPLRTRITIPIMFLLEVSIKYPPPTNISEQPDHSWAAAAATSTLSLAPDGPSSFSANQHSIVEWAFMVRLVGGWRETWDRRFILPSPEGWEWRISYCGMTIGGETN